MRVVPGLEEQQQQQLENSEESLVDSVVVYTGPLGTKQRTAALRQGNLEFIGPTSAESDWDQVPKCADNVRKRMGDAVDLATIEYNPAAWQVRNGRLHENKRRALLVGNNKQQVERLYPDATPDDWWNGKETETPISTPPGGGPPSASASARAARSRDKSEQQELDEAEKYFIRVGEEYQAVIEDRRPCDASRDSSCREELGGGADMMYDPLAADAARAKGEKIDEFLAKGQDFNVKMLMMQALHTSGYSVKDAMKEFIRLYRANPELSITLNAFQEAKFKKLCGGDLIGRRKDFHSAAEKLGCRTEAALVNYYRWKTTSRTYTQMKEARNQDNTYCEICDDGGILIVCENCHKAYHLGCLTPPLEKAPDGDWYCIQCTHKSPAKLRRLSGPSRLSDGGMSPRERSDMRSSVARRLSMAAASSHRLAALKSIHKELFSAKTAGGSEPAAVRRPSGMDLDADRGCWVVRPGAGIDEAPSMEEQSSPGGDDAGAAESDQDGIGGVAADDDAESEEDVSEEDDSEPELRSKKPPSSPVSSASSAYQSDSSYHDGEDDDEEEEADGDSKKPAANPNLAAPAASNQFHPTRNEVYQASIPMSTEGLLICVAHHNGPRGVTFDGYRRTRSGGIGPAQQNSVFRAVGDQFLEIDGCPCLGKDFDTVKAMLRNRAEGQANKYLKMIHTPAGSACVAASQPFAAIAPKPSAAPVAAKPVPPAAKPVPQQHSPFRGGPYLQNAQSFPSATPQGLYPPNGQLPLQAEQPPPPQIQHQQNQGWYQYPQNGQQLSPQFPAYRNMGWYNQCPPNVQFPASTMLPMADQVPTTAPARQPVAKQVPATAPAPQPAPVLRNPVPAQTAGGQQRQSPTTVRAQAAAENPSALTRMLHRHEPEPQADPEEPPVASLPCDSGTDTTANEAAAASESADSSAGRDSDLSIPDLLAFLKTQGIDTPEAFLDQNVVALAESFAEEKRIPRDVALDYLGAARVFVRKNYLPSP